jgi:PPOX class probable F420-dependent enzyme
MSADLTPEVIDRLTNDQYGWLTTVAKSGQPVPKLIWFHFDGAAVFIYTVPGAAKVAHVQRHPWSASTSIPTATAAASS